jgi:hypothetical protein
MAKWQGTIEAAEPDVERVLAEEHEEAALRRAEMEANKAAVSTCNACNDSLVVTVLRVCECALLQACCSVACVL